MQTYDNVEKLIDGLIKKYDDGKGFAHGISEDKIKRIEELLDVKLPEQYKWFLRKYGEGGFMGIEIMGYVSEDFISVVSETKSYRELFNLDKDYIIIEDIDEYYYCISCKSGKVFTGDMRTGPDTLKAETFLDFLYERFTEAAENWADILEKETNEE